MKNKKGFLLGEETLKIILAVVAIGFLIYFLGSLYFNNNVKNLEKEEAKASLEFLMKEMRGKAEKIEVYNPENWHILSWSEKIPEDEDIKGIENYVNAPKPEDCGLFLTSSCLLDIENYVNAPKPEDCEEWSNCICICNTKSCEERICKKSEKTIAIVTINDKIELTNSIKIENPPLRMEIEYAERTTILINRKNEP